MAAIEEQLLADYFEQLVDHDEINEDMVEKLRELLTSDGKLKADDFVQVFAPPSDEVIP